MLSTPGVNPSMKEAPVPVPSMTSPLVPPSTSVPRAPLHAQMAAPKSTHTPHLPMTSPGEGALHHVDQFSASS